MSYPQEALKQQLRICEAAAITPEEKAGCAYWRKVIERGQAEYWQAQTQAAVNFAQAKASEKDQPQQP